MKKISFKNVIYKCVWLIFFTIYLLGCSKKSTISYEAIKTSAQPKIDGEIDSIWNKCKLEQIKKYKYSKEFLKSKNSLDLSASFKSMWDDENLYFLFNVTDDQKFVDTANNLPAWENDCVEIFIDMNNLKTPSFGYNSGNYKYEFVYGRKEINSNNSSTFENIDFAVKDKIDGYQIEVKFPFQTLGIKPHEGLVFGCELAVDDNDKTLNFQNGIYTKPLRAVVTWAEDGLETTAYDNSSVFGNITLKNSFK